MEGGRWAARRCGCKRDAVEGWRRTRARVGVEGTSAGAPHGQDTANCNGNEIAYAGHGTCAVPCVPAPTSAWSLRHFRKVVCSCGTKGLRPAPALAMSRPRVPRMAALMGEGKRSPMMRMSGPGGGARGPGQRTMYMQRDSVMETL